MREKTKTLIAEALGIELTDVDEESSLREDLGLEDSDLREILQATGLEDVNSIPPDDLSGCKTVSEFLNLIEQYGPEEL